MTRVVNGVGWLIAAAFLGFGLIRLGVGSVLLGQAIGLIDFTELATALGEVEVFIAERAEQQWIRVSAAGYFAYILAMGAVLTAGAVGAFLRRRWGHGLIAGYLGMHAALFVNFQEVNPKLINFGITVLMLVVLVWTRPARREVEA